MIEWRRLPHQILGHASEPGASFPLSVSFSLFFFFFFFFFFSKLSVEVNANFCGRVSSTLLSWLSMHSTGVFSFLFFLHHVMFILPSRILGFFPYLLHNFSTPLLREGGCPSIRCKILQKFMLRVHLILTTGQRALIHC